MKKLLLGAVALAAILGTSTGAFAGPPPPPPPFGFGFGFGFGPFGPHPHPFFNDCESTDQILSDLGDDGYYHIHVVDWGHHELTVDARRGGHSYELTVDQCSGDIIDRQPL